ncbi:MULTISPECIES: metal ABC transporter permease [Anoxybacillus]|uniref:Manganese transport system membrane protein MntC n=1 Tax=Anoxybacillus flavithermus TaxID=33934 RepID=A0A178TM69_9BACL|nr:metal ABC transporter permease [Anoxybacillus flavithermus]ASA95829.1 metal ABC transporter permease [Anoxybacillus flavithermus]ELK22055.1 Mn2+ ABC transporter permease [Anoxybacillus flavithermus TNO-09.006]MBE2906036.1 metal ABC transporter permease [Anoxybacillus flavithermus]MBE2908625.1 metal ABC transporter permease [Anoxybacillus flavithermus]MBE2911303.1 metal ABC transporter permease [Anoxybacillus flavithermus]
MDVNVQWVFTSMALLGLASGMIGTFALLKKQSLIGDAMAHAALPGICIAFLFYGQKSLLVFLIGAACSGYMATVFIQFIVKHTRIKEDAAIGIVLSVFFGLGIVLLTWINQHEGGNQSGINDFLFGKAASLTGNDVNVLTITAVLMVITILFFFKEFKIITFDRAFAQGVGIPVSLLNGVLMFLIVSVVVIGLQAVGVVLMSALLITPALAARYWTERLGWMTLLAGVFGALSGVAGAYVSLIAYVPTGPLVIIFATALFLFSFLFAPKRGLCSKIIRRHVERKKLRVKQLMYERGEQL